MAPERVNITDLPAEVLTVVRERPADANVAIGTFLKEKAEPQQPYGQPLEIPQVRKSEVEKKHIKRTGQ